MTQRYCIAIEYEPGQTGYLSHRGRREWSFRTALQHYKDCIRMQEQGHPSWVDVFRIALTTC
jgi:hypothetical protein